MAWIGSQLRDAAYGRITIDPQNTSDRARAYEAHFLRHALVIDEKTPLPEFYREFVAQYPEDVFESLNYPSSVLPPVDIRSN